MPTALLRRILSRVGTEVANKNSDVRLLEEGEGDIENLKRMLQVSETECKSLRESLKRAGVEHDRLKQIYQEEKEGKRAAKQEAARLKTHVQDLQRAISMKNDENASLREGAKNFNNLQHTLRMTRDTAEDNARQLTVLRTAFADQEKLLNTRSAELRQAQAYLSTADRISHADVLGMVERLNADIYQLAASIADAFQYDSPSVASSQLTAPVSGTERFVAHAVIELLGIMSRNSDSSFVQLALQTMLMNVAAYVVESWDVQFDATQNELLTRIYEAVLQNEPPPVSGKWRSLTHQYAHVSCNEQELVQSIARESLRHMRNILQISGCSTPLGEVEDALPQRFGDKIETVIHEILALQRAIKHEVLSSSMQIVCPVYNQEFDPAAMDDANGDSRRGKRRSASKTSSSGSRVLCTNSIGLRRVERRTTDDDPQTAKLVIATVLKAEVTLIAFAEELVEEYGGAAEA